MKIDAQVYELKSWELRLRAYVYDDVQAQGLALEVSRTIQGFKVQ